MKGFSDIGRNDFISEDFVYNAIACGIGKNMEFLAQNQGVILNSLVIPYYKYALANLELPSSDHNDQS